MKKQNRKVKKELLKRLCLKYFGKDFEHWNWEVDSGNVIGYPRKIASAIELPKYDINNNLIYTDPFVAYSGGESKSLEICCDNAISYLKQKFNT
jgi:hypothetical protein